MAKPRAPRPGPRRRPARKPTAPSPPPATPARRSASPPARTQRDRNRLPDAIAAAATPESLPVVVAGVGASAGGFEAFSQLLASLPPDPGLAIVFVQHLSPTHQSALPQLLASVTPLPVEEATDGVVVRPNRIYVTPANVQLRLQGEALRLVRRPSDRSQYSPIDAFFRSLAENAESAAIGVLLSGNSSDGVAGLRDIRAAGGTVLVQDPRSARFDPMPRAAVNADIADMILPPGELGPALARLAGHPRGQPAERLGGRNEDQAFRRIFQILRAASGVDFTHYKQPTIRRRLQRRMVLGKITDLDSYLRHLENTPGEVQSLYDDLLIQVTRFFRDPETFEALASRVFPPSPRGDRQTPRSGSGSPAAPPARRPTRWPSTLLEHLGDPAASIPIQIFATDISDKAIDRARVGLYPESIAEDVKPSPPAPLLLQGRWRLPVAKQCAICACSPGRTWPAIPPSRAWTSISCRNVLIYLDPPAQEGDDVFHYALRVRGSRCWARPSRRACTRTCSSSPTEGPHLPRKTSAPTRPSGSPQPTAGRPVAAAGARASARDAGARSSRPPGLLLARFAPPGVLVTATAYPAVRGHTGPFLELAPGDASLNLLKMAREGLLFGLRAALNEARRSGTAVRREGMRVRVDGVSLNASLEVLPLGGPTYCHFLVLFEPGLERPDGPARPRKGGARPRRSRADD